MRTMQEFGLTPKARLMLNELRKKNTEVIGEREIFDRYKDGRIEKHQQEITECKVQTRTWDTLDVWYGDGVTLEEYLVDGKVVYRIDIQAEPWSSGPCIFLALKDSQGNWIKESLWDEEIINNC